MKDDAYHIAAIVLAGGRGKRMNTNMPKQYLQLNGYPVLYYSLKAFEKSPVDSIVLVCGKGEENYCREQIVEKYHLKKVKAIVQGGQERYHSVFNGLKMVKDSDYVLIHDGARPFVTEEIIENNIKAVICKKACVTGVPSKDTVKIADVDGSVAQTPDRSRVWIVQTPQTFQTDLIYEAYEKILKEPEIHVTDDAMAVETALKQPVYFVMGSYQNIKITTPEDLQIGEIFARNSSNG
ncbi:MAG TPA: 2-C-methyl-D-erythritol 4-phosphate cytidylyltransferase [Candidatus Scybalocola faecavium]|nr:2-C-methyl-D-erythritol 4-phosphate cytidylyltransferase [Candidatus Scybalocola faecavium]